MRWLVEVSPVGGGASEATRLVVEATQWQPALRAARELRGEPPVLSGFSIELLADGYRAVDPTTNLRYEVRRTDDDAPLTTASEIAKPKAADESAKAPAEASPPASEKKPAPKAEPEKKADDAPKSEKRPEPKPEPKADAAPKSERKPAADDDAEKTAPKVATEKKPEPKVEAAKKGEPAPKSEKRPEAKPDPKPDAKEAAKAEPAKAKEASPASSRVREVLLSRDEEASTESPITYRERIYLVAPGLAERDLGAVLEAKLVEVRAELEPKKAGKLVNLALYDQKFEGKPKTRPLATLRWKDWAKGGAEIAFPRASAAVAAKPAPDAPTERHSTAPPPRKTDVHADDLIGDLFEAMHDLHFVGDVLEGAAWVLGLATQKLEASAGYVHFYDINRREFVVVRAVGARALDAVLLRTPEKEPLLAQAMRRRQAIVVGDATAEARPSGERWAKFGDDLRSVICAPVMLAGRFLGAIEVINPNDGGAFVDADGHALSYIAEQLGEYLAARGITVDPERVKPSEPAEPAVAPKSVKASKSPPRPTKR